MSNRKQFFGLRYPETNKPAFVDQLGVDFSVSGVVLGGDNLEMILYLPGELDARDGEFVYRVEPTTADWVWVLRTLDVPEIFETEPDGKTVKAIHRKTQRAVGSNVQWTVYHRDGYRCQFCERRGGVNGVSLTVDHFQPVALGGTDEYTNLITACRSCNKQKASQPPDQYFGKDKAEAFREYLRKTPV